MSTAAPHDSRSLQQGRSHTTTFTLIVLLLLLIALWFFRAHLHFDWLALARQLRNVSLLYICGAVAITYFGYWLRAIRWSVLLAPMRKIPARELLSAQVIGFSLIALLGRAVPDLLYQRDC